MIINGVEVPLSGFDLGVAPPRTALKISQLSAEGEITAYIEIARDPLRQWMGAYRNWLLRLVRPHMPKRQFQRLRGRAKADAGKGFGL